MKSYLLGLAAAIIGMALILMAFLWIALKIFDFIHAL